MTSTLFTPLTIGPVRLRNRVLRAAAFEGMCPDQRPSPALTDYHVAVAKGGVGMTTVAYAAVERSGLSFPHQLWLRPEVTRPLRDLTDRVHAEGARASIQLGHCGNMAKSDVAGGRPLAPSSRFNLYGPTWPRAMDPGEIDRVVASFGTAVSLARDAGFDAVEVHAGHGYLISQFLSPYTNHRKDAYGGPLDRRMRFLREAVSRARKAAGDDIAVLVKMNLRDGFAGGQELDEGVKVAKALEELGVHALVLSGGFVSRAPMYILRGAMPMDVMRRGMAWWMRAGVSLFGGWLVPEVPYREGYFLEDALVVRGEVKVPLVYVGGAASRAAIDLVLSKGFEAVAMARALIREPDFVNRLKAEEAVSSPCDHCNTCAARIYSTTMECPHGESAPVKLGRGPEARA